MCHYMITLSHVQTTLTDMSSIISQEMKNMGASQAESTANGGETTHFQYHDIVGQFESDCEGMISGVWIVSPWIVLCVDICHITCLW